MLHTTIFRDSLQLKFQLLSSVTIRLQTVYGGNLKLGLRSKLSCKWAQIIQRLSVSTEQRRSTKVTSGFYTLACVSPAQRQTVRKGREMLVEG